MQKRHTKTEGLCRLFVLLAFSSSNKKKMVRSVFADTSIEKYLDNLIEQDEFSYGIIIGQVIKQ